MPFADDLPSKSQVFWYWKDKLSELGFLIDWGEPSCWACGFHYKAKYDIRRSDADWETLLKGWEKIPLQRCHIVPRSLGGSDAADNLFLMCRECHDTAPNTSIPDLFFEWARSQSWYARERTKVVSAFNSFDVKEHDYGRYGALMDSSDFKAWISGKLGLHRPQSSYAPTSSRLTPSTFVGLAVFYSRQHGNKS